MTTIELSKKEARRLALTGQGLHQPASFGRGKRAVATTIDQLGYVQIDSISVVARAHNHVLLSRVPNFNKQQLIDLQLKERRVFEYWAHAAAYLPMSHYRHTIPTMQHFREEKDGWPKVDQQLKSMVLDRIRSEGPLKSKDFEASKNPAGNAWWQWKPAKMALQRLFFEGELMVSHREGFQRVFDLAERVIPDHIDTSPPTSEEYADFLIDNYLRAHGLGDASMISYLRKGVKPVVRRRLVERHENQDLIEVRIKGAGSFFSKSSLLDQAAKRISQRASILSPFDNSVIQRNRLAALFNFEYQIECYVPSAKRVHGYYVLPILIGDRFLGRLDAKADRKTGVFNLIQLFVEPKVNIEQFAARLAPALVPYAIFNSCSEIEISDAVNPQLRDALLAHLPN